ncbi:MAG: STAS domain-containing protein [Candidatus Brocadiia bacterium]
MPQEDRTSKHSRKSGSSSHRSGRMSLPEYRRVSDDFYGGYMETARKDTTLYVRVLGLGSLSSGAPLRNLIKDCLADGCDEFIFDLSSCQGMDSTFMGILAGLSLDLHEGDGGMVMLLGMSDYNRHLLVQLGVLELLDEGDAELPSDLEWVRLDPSAASALDRAKSAYEAHNRLIHIKPENRQRFADFLVRLGHDLFPFLRGDEHKKKPEEE